MCRQEEAERADTQETVNNETQQALENFIGSIIGSQYHHILNQNNCRSLDGITQGKHCDCSLDQKYPKWKNNTNSTSGDGRNKKRKLRNAAVDIHGKDHKWKHNDDIFYDPTV